MDVLTVTHNSGFFSCCCVRLLSIVDYYNKNKKLPDKVDSSNQFVRYKTDKSIDYTPFFFKSLDTHIPYDSDIIILNEKREVQFSNYNLINFDKVIPLFTKYFTISDDVETIVNQLKTKYNLDYNNTCAVLYRGNDKNRETKMAPYKVYIEKAKEIKQSNVDIKFLVQTDERQFLNEFIKHFPDSIYFTETPTIGKSGHSVHKVIPISERKDAAINFLSAIINVSKCKHIITHTGNCSLFTILFRGNKNNVYQYFTESLSPFDPTNYSYLNNDVLGDKNIRDTWI